MNILYILSVTVIILSFYIRRWVCKRRQRHTYFSRLNIPNPRPHLLYGNYKQLRSCSNKTSIDVTQEWVDLYGKVFGFYIGDEPYLMVTDLDMIQQILVKEFSNFSNRPRLPIAAYPVTETLVGLRDGRWKQVRSILAPTFSMAKMKLQEQIMQPKICKIMQIVEEKRASEASIEWHHVYQGLTLDVISECALAMKSDCQEDQQNNALIYAVRQFLRYAINPAIVCAICIPTLAKIMAFVSNKLSFSGRMTQLIVANLKCAINRRHTNGQQACDVLQLMLDSRRKYGANNNITDKTSDATLHVPLTDGEIIANSWVFVLGGFETTSSALTYTTYLLALNQGAQNTLFQELLSLGLKDPETLKYEDLKPLKYLDNVLNESLRIYPPIVSFLNREAKHDVQIGKYFIPKGTNVQIPIWQIHRDPDQWPNPERFDPDRFTAEEVKKRHPMSHLPFGAGPRNCIGMKFAMVEIKLTLARLFLKYRIEISEKTENPLQFEIPTVALNPVNGVYLKAFLRNGT